MNDGLSSFEFPKYAEGICTSKESSCLFRYADSQDEKAKIKKKKFGPQVDNAGRAMKIEKHKRCV